MWLDKIAHKLGLLRRKKANNTPYLAEYSLIILDSLMNKSDSLPVLLKAIKHYPEDTHNEGHVCDNMIAFMTTFSSFELLKQGVDQQFIEKGGRKAMQSQQQSMEKLESWYE
ncbi:MAG: hypothetical protein COA90_00010 [Gammaproteobacteria bacterium]|nr:MAG: hypothetical protein COA90_00010 [Gammaproteobacteria bacterium]